MFKLSVHFVLPALLLFAGAATAQTQHVVANDAPAQLYVKCTTAGSDEYDGRQCIAFRAAANREISACMSRGAANSHGYRALRLKCVEQQAAQFTDQVD
ncbi:MAG: hypothetical protein ACKO2N_19230 [Tabrizicola sp.]